MRRKALPVHVWNDWVLFGHSASAKTETHQQKTTQEGLMATLGTVKISTNPLYAVRILSRRRQREFPLITYRPRPEKDTPLTMETIEQQVLQVTTNQTARTRHRNQYYLSPVFSA